jgi:hypothetical protein
MQLARLAFSLALASAGNNIAARMAMIAMTTSNSIKVNPVEHVLAFLTPATDGLDCSKFIFVKLANCNIRPQPYAPGLLNFQSRLLQGQARLSYPHATREGRIASA